MKSTWHKEAIKMSSKGETILIKGMEVFREQGVIPNGYVKIKDERIIGVGSCEDLSNENDCRVIELSSSYKAIPGFIDLHIHGVNGADVMDATIEALDLMATSLPSEGTTSFLATTITQSIPSIEKALVNAGSYQQQQVPGKAEVVGIHLEGPFVNTKRAGAQPLKFMIDPDLVLFDKWQQLSKGTIKMVTLAPELTGGLELVHYLSENNIIASIGHSDATFSEAVAAIENGVTQATHLYNQMRGLHHREPGVVGAVLLSESVKAEIIADGIHVRPEMIKLAYKVKGSDGTILITDSMRAKCLKNGIYDLGGQDVYVTDEKAVLKDGTLAGSILKLGNAFKNIISFTDCSIHEAIAMAAVNPAKQLKMYDRKGSLTVGKDADIVILDENLDVYMTYCRGVEAFCKGGNSGEYSDH